MTEAEWLACPEAGPLLRAGAVLSERKLRLIGVACFRAAWGRSPGVETEHAVAAAEAFADGSATGADVSAAGAAAQLAWADVPNRGRRADPAWAPRQRGLAAALEHLTRGCRGGSAARDVRAALNSLAGHYTDRRTEQAAIVRDITGNPFRPVAFAPEWHTADAVGLAEAIYGRRAFHDLPILADALQDAGCDSPDLLDHLRGPGPHARGCWALDLVLGRA